jgi:lipopolysaccharide biosynthesis regulator YciM
MSIRIAFLSIIVFAGILVYLYSLNPVRIQLQYFWGSYWETSLSVLLIGSFLLGAVITFLIYFVRDTLKSMKDHKEHKLREHLWESFYQATDALFKGDLPKAEKQILAYLNKKPDDPKVYLKLVEVYQRAGKSKKAIETLERAKGLKIDQLEILFREAQIYKETKDYAGAIKTFEEIIALNPTNREAMKELRDIYIEEKEWEEALKVQRKIIKVSPQKEYDQEKKLQRGIKYERARRMAEGGEKDKGIRELKDIIREDSSFSPPHVLLGELLRRAGKTKEAIKIWSKGFEKTHEIILLNKLEDLYLTEEDPRGIIHLYLDAMKKEPNNIVIPFFYARLCLRLEMIDEALEKLEEMEPNLAEHPSYHYLLAEGYSHRGDYEHAAEEYRKGLELEGGTYIPYRCTSCQREVKDWLPLCPSCNQWGTLTACTQEEIKVPLAPHPSQLMNWDF